MLLDCLVMGGQLFYSHVLFCWHHELCYSLSIYADNIDLAVSHDGFNRQMGEVHKLLILEPYNYFNF